MGVRGSAGGHLPPEGFDEAAGGSEPLPRLRRQSGAGQDFSSFIFLHTYIYSVRSDQIIFTQSYPFGASKGLLPQEADDTSRHVEADGPFGAPPIYPQGGVARRFARSERGGTSARLSFQQVPWSGGYATSSLFTSR